MGFEGIHVKIGDKIPCERGFQDDQPLYWWRVEWDEECFCHVQGRNRDEAVEKAFIKAKMDQQPRFVTKVENWVVVAVPKVKT
jgi:hypothetical protein